MDGRPGNRHNLVVRVTKTLLVTRLQHSSNSRERFRLEDGDGVPYQPYGGTRAHIGCQRPGQLRR